MNEERVVELDIGCHPEAAVSGGMLFQSESSCFLTFNAMSNQRGGDGRFCDLGTAIIDFGAAITQFGQFNDEAMPEHPLYENGLKRLGYAFCEVLNSTWAMDVAQRGTITAKRIRQDRFAKIHVDHDWAMRHFIVSFHDSTFECLARKFTVNIYREPWDQTVARIMARLNSY